MCIRDSLISSISESNYKVIMDAIREKKEIIVDYLYDGMKKNIENNKKKIAYKSVEGIGSINVGKILKSRYISKIVLDARKMCIRDRSYCFFSIIKFVFKAFNIGISL